MLIRRPSSKALLLLLGVSGIAASGCGGGSNDPVRYDLRGKVTCDGRPVRKGMIYFTPDSTQGNDGPSASAAVISGIYKTAPSAGVIRGPHIVTINDDDRNRKGQAPEGGSQSQFGIYKTTAEIGAETSSLDFDVPAANISARRKLRANLLACPPSLPSRASRPSQRRRLLALPQITVATPYYNYAALEVLAWTCRVLALAGLCTN